MKDLRSDSFFRLETILLMLSGEAPIYSIRSLHELLTVSLEMIRNDIATLYKTDSGTISFVFYDDAAEEDLENLSEQDFEKNLKRGKYDDARLAVYLKSVQDIEVVLDTEEYDCLSDFVQQQKALLSLKPNEFPAGHCLIKNSVTSITADEQDLLQLLEQTIKNELSLSFDYYVKEENQWYSLTVRPVKVLSDVDSHRIYIVDDQLKLYRLDRTKNIHVQHTSAADSTSDTPDLSVLDYVWGTELSLPIHPIHVKVRIQDEANVPERVRIDLGEKAHGSFYQQDGCYYYEDDIIGINAFLSWVYSYGSSMIVEEPPELVDRIKKSIERRLSRIVQ